MIRNVNRTAETLICRPYKGMDRLNDAQTDDIRNACREVLAFCKSQPLHVVPWLRGVEAAAEAAMLDVWSARRRADAKFLAWLEAGLEESDASQ